MTKEIYIMKNHMVDRGDLSKESTWEYITYSSDWKIVKMYKMFPSEAKKFMVDNVLTCVSPYTVFQKQNEQRS